MDYKRYKGIVYSFPEEENSEISLEIARFLEVGNERKLFYDEQLNAHRAAMKSSKVGEYFGYVGDIDEVFEFYLESSQLTDTIFSFGLTLQYGEIDTWSKGEDVDVVWSKEVKEYLAYIKENYFICTQTFLDQGNFSEMYEEYCDGVVEIDDERDEGEFDDEEAEERKAALRKKIEQKYKKDE